MQEILAVGGLALSGGTVLGLITFWMKLQRAITEAADDAKDAKALAIASTAKCDLLTSMLAEARIESARDIARITTSNEHHSDALLGLKEELRGVNSRLDQIISSKAMGA